MGLTVSLMLSRMVAHRAEHGLYRRWRYNFFTSATALVHSAGVYGIMGRALGAICAENRLVSLCSGAGAFCALCVSGETGSSMSECKLGAGTALLRAPGAVLSIRGIRPIVWMRRRCCLL